VTYEDREKVVSGFYVVVTGGPGSGKTALAEPLAHELGLPLFSKDLIKEALFDELGTGDRLWARRLGRASITALYRLAAHAPAAVLEAVFARDAALADLKELGKPLIEIHCSCDPGTALARFEERAGTHRHPGHLDERQPRNKVAELVQDGCTPLGLGGPVLSVDTEQPVDVAAVADWVRIQPEYQLPW
jgi:predicted kinase